MGILPSNLDDVRAADAELVAKLRRGDLDAFEQLYHRHRARLYSLAYRMMGNPPDAEDLLQEIFLQVYRKLESFHGESALTTWLYRLATNLCLDRLRSREVRMAQVTTGLDEVEAARRGFSRGAIDKVDLERAIAKLPTGYRMAFLLHDVEGFEHHEVAEILGIAEGTSKSQVHKARLKVRESLTGQPTKPDGRTTKYDGRSTKYEQSTKDDG